MAAAITTAAITEHALDYAGVGWAVFPVRPYLRSPHPDGSPERSRCHASCGELGHGFHDATTDPDVIRRMWERSPRSQIAVRLAGTATVIDVDTSDLAGQMRLLGLDKLPHNTPITRSPGGWHLWFSPRDDIAPRRQTRFVGLCDLLSDGGITVPPSRKNGTGYVWERPLWLPLPELPTVVLRHATRPLKRLHRPTPAAQRTPGRYNPSGLIARLATAENGTRNETLVWASNRLGLDVRSGKVERSVADDIAVHLETVAIDSGLTPGEARGTCMSGYVAGLDGKGRQ